MSTENTATAKAAPLTYATAKAEIQAGRAEAHALWMLLLYPTDRDGYALKPEVWEGRGQYQHVTHQDGRSVLVHLPHDERPFLTRKLIEENARRKAERDRARRLMEAAPRDTVAALADALAWALDQIEDDLDPEHQQAFAHARAVLASVLESTKEGAR